MAKLSDVSNRALREMLGTHFKSRTLVNLQDATATFDGVSEPDAIMVYSIAGNIYTTADVTNKALATLEALQKPITGRSGYYTQPDGKTVYYVACVNAAGTMYVIQGTYSGQDITLPDGGKILGTGEIPDIVVPDTYAPFAVFKVVTSGGTFVPATTNWNAAGVVAYAAPVTVLPKQASDLTFVEGGA